MQFTAIILATIVTVAIANPLCAPKDAMSANVFGRDDCQPCHDYYNKCRGVSKTPSYVFQLVMTNDMTEPLVLAEPLWLRCLVPCRHMPQQRRQVQPQVRIRFVLDFSYGTRWGC
jgi:hypothetical protein